MRAKRREVGFGSVGHDEWHELILKRDKYCARRPLQHSIPRNAAEMELDCLDPIQDEQLLSNRSFASPVFVSSKEPATSPQPWELHDVDFLLPGPIASSARSFFQDLSRKHPSSLHESDLAFSPELDDAAKPISFCSETHWQDMALNDSATNEFSRYLADAVLSDNVVAQPKSPSSKSSLDKSTPPATVRINASDEDFAASPHPHPRKDTADTLKNVANVVSPTTSTKKTIVTENDLKLFSSVNMRALSAKKAAAKSAPRLDKKTKVSVTTCSNTPDPSLGRRQRLKRCASFKVDNDDHTVRVVKRTKSLNQQAWSAPTFDLRWYWGKTEGFHGMQPKLLSPIDSSTSQDYSGSNIYWLVQQTKQCARPQRKIGIYSPSERRERLKRFHEKRKLRVYHKRIKYDCRKRLANSCPRIKGRFVRKSESLQAKESDTAESTTPESTTSSEDCLL